MKQKKIDLKNLLEELSDNNLNLVIKGSVVGGTLWSTDGTEGWTISFNGGYPGFDWSISDYWES